MAGKLLVSCLRNSNRVSIRLASSVSTPSSSSPSENFLPGSRIWEVWQARIGKREWVGYGCNSLPQYLDLWDFPFPAIRYKEITPDLQVIKEKEKGDWKKLSLEEKKTLYRASFCQTFAELEAPTGEWKGVTGCVLMGIALALSIYICLRLFIYPPWPASVSDEGRTAAFKRIRQMDVNPIWGFNKRPDL